MRVRYPRTPHLPWSPGATSDDVRLGDLSGLRGRQVVVTEKLDGENTTLYADGLHARSLDSAHHPSRAWVKGLQGRIAAEIPPGWRICGENVYARHSIAYSDLESWFYGFSVWDGDRCLDWDATVRFLRRLGIPVPRVLWRGVFDERALRALRLDTARQEGYVVRTVAGFGREDFAGRVAKWVRRQHVRTDAHWMHAAVVPNRLGPAAALWAVRAGETPTVDALLAALAAGATDTDARGDAGRDVAGGSVTGRVETTRAAADAAVADVAARLDEWGRRGDARLAGVLAALLHGDRRAALMRRLDGPLGMPLARRVADLVGLYPLLHRPYPDGDRRSGLVRMSFAADLAVLHAVAGAALTGRAASPAAPTENARRAPETTGAEGTDPETTAETTMGIAAEIADAREQVEWSALHAEDAGLLDPAPLAPLRAGLREALAGLDPAAADRCWAEAREAAAAGRVTTAPEAVAATWRWRSGNFPRLVHMVGPSGSGKSTVAARFAEVDTRVSLDDLREARGSRADQRANREVLREGLHRLDAALAAGGTVVWDATSLSRRQRSLVHAVARRRDALVTHAVFVVDDELLQRRNAARRDPVPADVLAGQLRRFDPPYPGEAHRTWYIGATGTIGDVDGVLDGSVLGDGVPDGGTTDGGALGDGVPGGEDA